MLHHLILNVWSLVDQQDLNHPGVFIDPFDTDNICRNDEGETNPLKDV
jgi:hypothetical protein